MNRTLFSLSIVIVIILSMAGIVKLIPNLEYVLGFLSLSFAILAVIWAFIANFDLSKGSSLRIYASNFLICTIFLLFYSVFQVFGKLLDLTDVVHLGYVLISIAYLALALTAYRILKLSREFGFKPEVKRIKRRLKGKK